MARLSPGDIKTREVLDWRGLHLFHFAMSSCSQKVRLYLRLKGIAWTPHPVDLSTHENYGPRFLGINPRGMVPVLVLDGAVHVGSNDILLLLEALYPEPCLVPPVRRAEIERLLEEEDALHHDLRHLSFRFVHGRTGTTKTPELMAAYRAGGSVGGGADAEKEAEIEFYERLARTGLDDATCRASAERFRAAFDGLEARIGSGEYLLGASPTVIDIAWFVYAYRLVLGGYPLARLHPRIAAWYARRLAEPGWEAEVAPSSALAERIAGNRRRQEEEGRTLEALMAEAF